MKTLALSLFGAIVALAPVVFAQTSVPAGPASAPAAEKVGAEDLFAITQSAAPGLVRVEYTLQYDKGEAPAEELIAQERPWETEGFVLAPTKVLCDDFLVHPRFVKEIAVRCGEQRVKAKVAAWGRDRAFAVLELAEPLKKAKPIVFDAAKKGPYLAASYAQLNGDWTVTASPLNLIACAPDTGKRFFICPPNSLVMDKKGVAVGLLTDRRAPADDSWKGSPLDKPLVTAEEMDRKLKDLEAKADQAIVRVSLNFRSPKKTAGRSARVTGDDESEGTERNVLGLLVEKQKVLVLALLNPKVTARLEKIVVYPVKGEAVTAKFDCTLADYGAMLITLEKPLDKPLALAGGDLRPFQDAMLYTAQVYLQGEKRVAYYSHGRIESFHLGWRRQVYPEASGPNRFQFDANGSLIILPIARREKVSEDRSSRSEAPLETASSYVKDVLQAIAKKTDLAQLVDSQNVPLTEEEENRLAWLGVELQPLDRELARSSNVSELTHDGATGAMVSYVYEDSPAAKAGIKMGDILLRLNVEGQPKPIDVQIEPERPIPWDQWWKQWDELPERVYDNLPTPWQSAENLLTRSLTDIGFGKKYSIEFFRDGKVMSKDLTIVEAPQHYESAPKYKDEATGITVRDMTFEVRRYFQRKPADPGVIISTLTAGSKGSVTGLKPLEIITQVNDKPVTNIKDFEKLVKGQGELRLNVLRLTRGRVVRIDMGGAAKSSTTQGSSSKPTEE